MLTRCTKAAPIGHSVQVNDSHLDGLGHLETACELDISAAASNINLELPALHSPSAGLQVPGRQSAIVQRQLDLDGFSLGEANALKPLELQGRLPCAAGKSKI